MTSSPKTGPTISAATKWIAKLRPLRLAVDPANHALAIHATTRTQQIITVVARDDAKLITSWLPAGLRRYPRYTNRGDNESVRWVRTPISITG